MAGRKSKPRALKKLEGNPGKRKRNTKELVPEKGMPACNLPCDYILHTVGPIIYGRVTHQDRELLASCYRSCLELAKQNEIKSVAFCCISTGEFYFPNDLAAEIAVNTVKQYRGDTEVIFNVFKDVDYEIYRELLG